LKRNAANGDNIANAIFLSYYPLKQGLKPEISQSMRSSGSKFLSYYPLKQGLKPHSEDTRRIRGIYFYPTIH